MVKKNTGKEEGKERQPETQQAVKEGDKDPTDMNKTEEKFVGDKKEELVEEEISGKEEQKERLPKLGLGLGIPGGAR